MVLSSSISESFGEPFKNLGVTMDPSLSMKTYITKIVNICCWQLSLFRRCLSFFNGPTMVRLYKAYIWPKLEYGIPAYFHCSPDLDDMRSKFLSLLGISNKEALLTYNIAPLAFRRKWSMFGTYS